MPTITKDLRSKIERRAKRAWKRRSEGSVDSVTRVSDVTDTSLKYRIPYTPDYYGSEKIDVILRPDGAIEVDPKTTGLLHCLIEDDLKKIKKHGDVVRVYVLTKVDAVVGKTGEVLKVGAILDLRDEITLLSRDVAIEKATSGDRAFAVDILAADVFGTSAFLGYKFTVVDELDQKELGFTTGLLDCLTADDVRRLHKHHGRVRAYKFTTKDAESPYQSPKIKYEPGKRYEISDADTNPESGCHKGINVADVEWCKGHDNNSNRMFAFEFDVKDIAAIPTSTDGKFRLHRCLCVEEVDPKTFKLLLPPAPVDPTPSAPVVTSDPSTEPTVQDEVKKKRRSIFHRLFGSDD